MRRAIVLETVNNPASISDEDLDGLIDTLSDEIQLLFPEDRDAAVLAYGMLSHQFRKGIEYPAGLEDDQIEDWLVGRAAQMIIKTQEHRRKVDEFLATKG